MHKNGKWAREILDLQEPDGKWGCFHSLAQSYGAPKTTEQALRRLKRLGFTIEDECIRRAVSYMDDCLTRKNNIPDCREKFHDWDVFTDLILATGIRQFTKENANANAVAEKWAAVITAGFEGGGADPEACGSHGIYRRSGVCNQARYEEAYRDILKPNGGVLLGFANYYHVSLLAGCLGEEAESAFLENIITGERGIYYIYEGPLTILPAEFQSKAASRYLAALELLADYRQAGDMLTSAVDWIMENRMPDGRWDMGKSVNDKVYFPLSDDWRKAETRTADCTERIGALLGKLIQNR
ncbi:MAG: hypothetical protein IJ497_01565 [Clostridia bacterium]|nr:hypothetical protein [Clostridia bacterium]